MPLNRLVNGITINSTLTTENRPTVQHCQNIYYETTHTLGFVFLAVCLVVWTPELFFTPSRVGISQVVQKRIIINNRRRKEEKTNTDLELQNAGR